MVIVFKQATGYPVDWYSDSDYYIEWDAPDSSYSTTYWDDDGAATMSETDEYAQGTLNNNSDATLYIDTKNTIPTNKTAYYVRGYFSYSGGAGNQEAMSGVGGCRFNSTNYAYASGSFESNGISSGSGSGNGSLLAVRTGLDTYDVYMYGYKVASGVNAITPICGAYMVKNTQSSSYALTGTVRKYFVRYTK